MSGMLSRRDYFRQRRGIEEIQFFDYDTSTGSSELAINFVAWFSGRKHDPAAGEEVLVVELLDVDPDSLANLENVRHVKIDGLYYSTSPGRRPPLGAGADQDYLMICSVRGTVAPSI